MVSKSAQPRTYMQQGHATKVMVVIPDEHRQTVAFTGGDKDIVLHSDQILDLGRMLVKLGKKWESD